MQTEIQRDHQITLSEVSVLFHTPLANSPALQSHYLVYLNSKMGLEVSDQGSIRKFLNER